VTVHWLSASNLDAKLAAGRVTAREQALYLIGGFIMPSPAAEDPKWFFGMWLYELAMMVLVTVAGVLYCLGKCHVDPKRNFLVDFSCLYLPVSVTTLVVAWGAFHALAALRGPWLELLLRFSDRPPQSLSNLASVRFFDLLRFLAIVGSNFAVFYRIGRHMGRIAELRQADATSAGPAVAPAA
jgi:hypothetical protein